MDRRRCRQPVDLATVVDVLRRAAEDYGTEVRTAEVYAALSAVRDLISKEWLARRYSEALIPHPETYREKQRQREKLRRAARGIQQACAAIIVREMNDLASFQYRKNKPQIDKLRRQLTVILRPIGR